MKKIVAFVMAFAMVAGFFAYDAKEAKAADGEYILLGSATGWDAGSAGAMTDNGDGTYSYTITCAVDDVIQFKIANAAAFATDSSWNTVIGDGNKSNFEYKATDTTVVVTYDANVTDRAGVTVTGAVNNKETGAVLGYNVAGDSALCGGANWSETAGAMTLESGVYSVSFTNVAAGTYSYKVLEIIDGAGACDSDYVYGLRDAGSNNGVVTVAADNTTVTFSINATTKAVTITQEESDDLTPADVEAVIDAIGTVTLDSLAAITAAEQAVEAYLAQNEGNSTNDIANYADLTAAKAAYEALAAAAVSEKNIHITIVGDLTAYDGVAFQTWCGLTTPNTVAINTLSSGWGDDNTTGVTKLTVTDGKADVVVTIDKADSSYNVYTGMQLLAYTATSITGVNTGNVPASLMAALESDATDIWMTFTLPTTEAPDGSWTVSTIDPSAITAADVEELIDAIGEVTLDSLAAITTAEQAVADYLANDEDNSTDDISNYAKLTAARAKYDELKAADDQAKAEADAAAAGELTVYVKAPESWTDMGLWAWTSAGNLFESWPGEQMTACENNPGYFKATIKITGLTSVIFNSSNNEQTKDIVDLSAGTYWFDLTLADGDDKYSAEYVTEAPEGWVEEEKAEIEVLDPTDKKDEDTTDKKDDDTTEGEDDAATAWDDAKLKVHVQMPDVEGWDALGAYLFGTGENFGWKDGSGELTGSWPGVELLPEVNSENGWYAFGGTFADGYYMLILNNFVSDEAAAAGAVKMQAADLEITDGEYWITIALDEETGKYVATVATEAPADYDGEGLETVVDTPGADEEPDGEDTPATPDDKDEAPDTGDAAPIVAVMMIALVAGASAVVIRRRKVA